MPVEYGAMTSEKERPSLITAASKQQHGLPFNPSAQTCRNVAETVLCGECLRPRVLHSQKKVPYGERVVIRRSLEPILYTCGSSLDMDSIIYRGDPPAASTVFQRVMVRLNLCCSDPVEVPYYSSECFVDICVHCACPQQSTIDGQYPICQECRATGKMAVLKRKRKQTK